MRITESSRRGKVKDGARRQWSDSKKRGAHLTARCAHGLLRFACEWRGDNGKVNEARVAFQRMPLYFGGVLRNWWRGDNGAARKGEKNAER